MKRLLYLLPLLLFLSCVGQPEEPIVEPEEPTEPVVYEGNISEGDLRKIVFCLVSSAENSSLDYKAQYKYIEDIGDGRGYTAGIIGFCSGTGDMLDVVELYSRLLPGNVLEPYLPALRAVVGSDSHDGLGDAFVAAWIEAARTPEMIQAQDSILNEQYMHPAIKASTADGLSPLGQYVYYDALVMHGPGSKSTDFGGIRSAALRSADCPSKGGDEATYLRAFIAARKSVMLLEEAHTDLSRLYTQEKFIKEGKFGLELPLTWTMYGDKFTLTEVPE